ncbi:MAG TPA: nitrile hydratase subunit beta [Candidatus Binataceae bacterium]|nr:nitrile hydratase subunit beta [Candidatus Binataceae bacterium]
MNGVHDLGGMDGFGPIPREENEPVFHADWERRMYGMARMLMNARLFNLDEYRHAIERIPPPIYLGAKYYEKWAIGATGLLLEKGILKPAELKGFKPIKLNPTYSLASKRARGAISHRSSGAVKARFKPGDKVIARNTNPHGHTRLPRYARGKRGTILFDEGVFPLPDLNAHGGEITPQHVYAVRFTARELWGEKAAARESVSIDLWEAYLEPPNGSRANGRGRIGRGRR